MAEKTAVVRNGGLSVDVWAVLLAFLLAVLVKFGVLGNIPW